MKLGAPVGSQSMMDATSADFPHKWSVMCLIAVGFWNFLGAGVFGFLINLPIVSYYNGAINGTITGARSFMAVEVDVTILKKWSWWTNKHSPRGLF